MERKPRTSFTNHEEWLAYVSRELSRDEQRTALRYGRMELFLRFLELRGQSLPEELKTELAFIDGHSDSDRVDRLNALNERIMEHLIEALFTATGRTRDEEKHTSRLSPRQQAQELLIHLTDKNPYFRLWIDYKEHVVGEVNERAWDEFLRRQLGQNDVDSLDFANAMVNLDRLLVWFHGQSIPLPLYFSERTWFLHLLREPERMTQTRVLLNTLAAEIPPCMSV